VKNQRISDYEHAINDSIFIDLYHTLSNTCNENILSY